MNNQQGFSIGEILFVILLTFLFAGLKIAQIIAWPWIWVLAPVWVSGIILFCKAMGVEIPTTAELISKIRNKNSK